MTDPVLLDVERLTFGFDALAHHGRQVVFVSHAAPGDRVAADVVERRPGYLRARVRSVVTPGPARVVPGCRYFPLCGGCQWQQVAPPAQRDAKAAIVAEQLARVAGVREVDVRPTLAPSGDWGYRGRISLVVEGRQAGYHRARSHRLLEVADCPIAEPVVAAHVEAARAWVASLRVPLRRVTIAAAPGGVVLVGRAIRRPGPADLAASEALLARLPSVRGTVVGGVGARLVAGDPTVRLEVEAGLDLEVPADAFTQVNFAANPTLVAAVLAAGAFVPGERVLDLSCGAGNLSLPVARRGAVVEGIERDAVAIAAADANAQRLGLKAYFRCASVADGLRARTGPPPDAAILDPPRQGAADAVVPLIALRPRRIVYVSCDPATLARDVRPFLAAGWRLRCVQPIDVFPQTYHVECVAELHLT
ncbi:MAG TPA: methyltransferase domain-containing protein [Solirubrobacteraceae bacterium]